MNTVDVAEMEIYVKDGELSGAANGTFNITYFGTVNAIFQFSAIISDGYLYLSYNSTENQAEMNKISLEELYNDMMSSMGNSSTEAGDTMSAIILPFVTDALLPVVEILIEDNKDATNDVLGHTLNIFFSFEEQADGSVLVTLSKDKVLALSEALATKPVAEVIDIYFGEGTFASVVDFAFEVLDLKVCDVPAYLKDKGIDYDTLVAEIEEFLPTLGASEDFDIDALLTNSDFSDLALGMLIFQTEDDSYKALVNDAIDLLKANTLYEMINVGDKEKTMVDDIINQVFDYVALSLTTDENGAFTAVHVELTKVPFGGSSMSDGTSPAITYTNYISFALDVIANGKIEIAWSDIIDKYNNAFAPVPDSIKKEYAFNIKTNEDSNFKYVYFQGEEYICQESYYVYVTDADFANVFPTIEANCGNWNYYYMSPVVGGSYCVSFAEVDGETVMFFIDSSKEAIKVVATTDGFFATYNNGETKELDIAKDDNMTLVELSAKIAPMVLEKDFYSNWETIEYYYNTVTGEYAFEEQHNWNYEYEMFGETCYDGYKCTQTCTKCNTKLVYPGYYHEEMYTEIYLEGCGGSISESRCKICNNVTYLGVYDWNCDWTYTSETNGYSVYKCANCDTTKMIKAETTEKDENCQYTVTDFYIFTINGKEIYRGQYSYTNTEHNETDHYEMQGESCEDGVAVYSHCLDCGYASETGYIHYGHISDGWNDPGYKWIDLQDYEVCYYYDGSASVVPYAHTVCCHVCNTEYGIDYHLPGCNMEIVSESDTSTTCQCTECGIIETTTWSDGRVIITLIIDGEEIYRSVQG